MSDDESGHSGNAARIRAFVALDLGARATAALVDTVREVKPLPWARDIRWVKPGNLHLTLRFLGDIEASTLPVLLRELEAALRSIEPFSFVLDGLAFFPSPNRPRVLAVGTTEAERISALAARVEAAVVATGLPEDAKRFRAHITLGRFRKPGRRRVDLEGRGPEQAQIDARDVVLYRSELQPSGARYSELGRVELAAPLR